MNLNDLNSALAGGTRWAIQGDTPVGVEVGGRIISAEVKQVRNFDTGQPESWDDGNPMNEVVVTVQTDKREDENDDGRRAHHVKTWGEQGRALKEAVRASGAASPADALAPGGEFYGTKTGSEPVAGKKYRKNLFTFRIVPKPAGAAGLDDALGEGAPGADDHDGADLLDLETVERIKMMHSAEVPAEKIAKAVGADVAAVQRVIADEPKF